MKSRNQFFRRARRFTSNPIQAKLTALLQLFVLALLVVAYAGSASAIPITYVFTGTASGTLIWGNIVTDQMQLTGSGALKMGLNPAATTPTLKVSLLK